MPRNAPQPLVPRHGLRIYSGKWRRWGEGKPGNVPSLRTGQPPRSPQKPSSSGKCNLPLASTRRSAISGPHRARPPSRRRRAASAGRSETENERRPSAPSPASPRSPTPPGRPIGCSSSGGGARAKRLAQGRVNPGAGGGGGPTPRRRLPSGCEAAKGPRKTGLEKSQSGL